MLQKVNQPPYEELLAENDRLKIALSYKELLLDDEHVARVISAAPDLTATQARYVLILYGNANRVVTQTMLADKVGRMIGGYPTYDAIKSAVTRARKAIKHWPVTIEAYNGVGYSMVIHDKTWRLD